MSFISGFNAQILFAVAQISDKRPVSPAQATGKSLHSSDKVQCQLNVSSPKPIPGRSQSPKLAGSSPPSATSSTPASSAKQSDLSTVISDVMETLLLVQQSISVHFAFHII